MTNKHWFHICKMGWMPCSWQGWTALAIYIALMYTTLGIPEATPRHLYGGCLTASLILVAMMKTKPRSAKK